jgi:type I restriction enzyme S subunit
MIFKNCIEKISTIGRKVKQVDYLSTGLLPVIDQGREFVGGYTNDTNTRIIIDQPVIIFGDHTRVIKFVNFDFAPGADGIKVFKPLPFLDPKYFAYILQAIRLPDKGYSRHYQYLEKSEIPIRPLPEQKRIVAKIESLFSRLDSAKDSLERVRAEIKRYRQSVFKSAFEGGLTEEWRKLQKRLKTGKDLLEMLRKSGKHQYKLLSRISLNTIPPEWTWGFIGDITNGVEYGSSKKSSEKGYIPVIRMGNLQEGRIDWGDLKFSSDQKEIYKYRLNNGDVLFNRTNSPELVGKTAIYNGEREAIFAGYLIRINQVSGIDPCFLNYYLNSQLPKEYGNRIKTDGVNQSNINGKKLCSYPFPILSIEEQLEIVAAIESRFERAKVLEDAVEQGLARIERLKQSILRKAFEGKLVEPDPNDEPVDVLLERIKEEKAKLDGKI